MHQIHHSNNPLHWDKNYGVALAIWDQIFGSYYRPHKEEASSLSFGLHENINDENWKEATTLKGALLPLSIRRKLEGRSYLPSRFFLSR